jgi:hypothetical protein
MPLSAPIRETGNGKRDQLLSEPGPIAKRTQTATIIDVRRLEKE